MDILLLEVAGVFVACTLVESRRHLRDQGCMGPLWPDPRQIITSIILRPKWDSSSRGFPLQSPDKWACPSKRCTKFFEPLRQITAFAWKGSRGRWEKGPQPGGWLFFVVGSVVTSPTRCTDGSTFCGKQGRLCHQLGERAKDKRIHRQGCETGARKCSRSTGGPAADGGTRCWQPQREPTTGSHNCTTRDPGPPTASDTARGRAATHAIYNQGIGKSTLIWKKATARPAPTLVNNTSNKFRQRR